MNFNNLGQSGVIFGNGVTPTKLQSGLGSVPNANYVVPGTGNLLSNVATYAQSNGAANPNYYGPAIAPGVFSDLTYLPANTTYFLNHPSFLPGSASPTATSFGQVSSTYNSTGISSSWNRIVFLRAYRWTTTALTLYPGTGCMIVGMKTGELARQAGVNIQTIRFYERERLLAAPPRTGAGYRCYSPKDLERVAFIKTCQQLGFTLEDIRSLAGLHDCPAAGAGGRPGEAERLKIAEIARERLRQVDEKLRQLTEMRAHLQAVCDASAPDSEPRCPAARLQNAS